MEQLESKGYYYIATMGCQMNEYDSDNLSQRLVRYGFSGSDSPERADLIIINTCSVREKAEQKAFSLLGRMIKLKKKKPEIILGFMGCLAQQNGSLLLKRYPELDLVLGTREVTRVHEFLDRIIVNNERIAAADLSFVPVTEIKRTDSYFKGRIKTHLSIMEGCNNFCSYCIVPYVRGREVSRAPKDILNEAKNLIDQGIIEITLLGQNVNSYYSGNKGEVNFPALLRMLGKLDGLKRIRFTTSHPKDLSEELIYSFKEIDKLCPHIHLPFQSGSNRILKLMNRRYTRDEYFELVMKLRETDPDFSITSDVIVGFPGETDKDFKNTLDLIEKIEFDNLFSFKYSDRKGTKAALMNNKIEEKVKAERLNILQDLQKKKTLIRNKRLEGGVSEILVDGLSKRLIQYSGRTATNKIVNFNCNTNLIGKLVKVKIKRSFINSLQGELVI